MNMAMSEFVHAFVAEHRPEEVDEATTITRESLAPAFLTSPGCRSVELFVGGSNDGETVEAMLVVRWVSRAHMEAALGRDELAPALHEMLLRIVGPPRILSLEPVDLGFGDIGHGDGEDAPPPPADLAAEEVEGDLVGAFWRKVQDGIRPDVAPDDFDEHPYIRWFFLNKTAMPDFVALARSEDETLAEQLLARYQAECIGGIDDLPDGAIDPRSKSAQHLYYLVRLQTVLGDLGSRSWFEIGGGFGNLARMALQLGLCASYDGLDIRNVVDLQQSYLERTVGRAGGRSVAFHTVEDDAALDALKARQFGLVVSNFALTETPRSMREWALELAVASADVVYITGQEVFRGQPVGEEISRALAETFVLERRPTPFQSANVGPAFELIARRRSSESSVGAH